MNRYHVKLLLLMIKFFNTSWIPFQLFSFSVIGIDICFNRFWHNSHAEWILRMQHATALKLNTLEINCYKIHFKIIINKINPTFKTI